jgi:hypothetical protein
MRIEVSSRKTREEGAPGRLRGSGNEGRNGRAKTERNVQSIHITNPNASTAINSRHIIAPISMR